MEIAPLYVHGQRRGSRGRATRSKISKIDCVCSHSALLTPEALARLGPRQQRKVLDLQDRVRCRRCGVAEPSCRSNEGARPLASAAILEVQIRGIVDAFGASRGLMLCWGHGFQTRMPKHVERNSERNYNFRARNWSLTKQGERPNDVERRATTTPSKTTPGRGVWQDELTNNFILC